MSADPKAGEPGSRATLAEVTALADVSISTVSKVLNGRSGVSGDTRARIESLLRDHQYNRRNPGPNHAPLIEVLCYEIDSAWAAEAIATVERLAREHNLGVVVSGTNDRHEPDRGWIEGVLNRRPVGVILIVSSLTALQKQQLRSRSIPFVMLDPAGQPSPDVPSIGSADWSGAYAATQHLIQLGHRDIAIITGPDDVMVAIARLSGFRAALEGAGIALRPEYVRRGEFHHSDGLSEGRALLSLPEPPTAIFASSDVQALGVYESARALGVAIPSELSVVGFDDLKIARWAGPALTTIRVRSPRWPSRPSSWCCCSVRRRSLRPIPGWTWPPPWSSETAPPLRLSAVDETFPVDPMLTRDRPGPAGPRSEAPRGRNVAIRRPRAR